MRLSKRALLLTVLLGVALLSIGAVARNVFTMSHTQEFGTIDPARGSDYTESYAMLNVYDALVFPASSGAIEPKLAKSWTISEDGLQYTFVLREDVVFHDGTPLTAEDVKYSIDRVLALLDGNSWLWASFVAETTSVDQYTISIRLSEPFAPFLSTLSWLFIVNKAAIVEHEVDGDWGTGWLEVATDEDAGSGPYTLKSWDRGRAIVFERFVDYWEGWPQGENHLDEVHSIFLQETATAKTMLRRGELTMVEHWRTYEDYMEMDEIPGVKVLTYLSPEVLAYKINTQIAPTDDVHIRRAMAWAFDYDSILNIVEPGSGAARGPIPPGIPGHDSTVFQYTQDLDKALEELKLSKYYPDIPTIVVVTPQGLEARRRVAVQFKETMATLGVDVEIRIEAWGRMTDLASTIETTPHVMIISTSAAYPDADTYLHFMYHSDSAGTWASCEWLLDPEIDRLIDLERTTVDPVERAQIMSDLQHMIVSRCPDIFVNVLALRVAVQEKLQGFTYRPVMSFYYYYRDWWYEE
jgi:peptide/nickel transport system substrate-binding protein